MLSATGYQSVRVPTPKNPRKYAAGMKAAASDKHPAKAFKRVRSSHLGYDCYVTGPADHAGHIRCILRAGRLPSHLPTDVRLLMPIEMWWPERDHAMAHGMIDAVIRFDLSALRAWKASWPEHNFGYEHFIKLAERRLSAVREGSIPAVPQLPPRLDGTAPVGQPVNITMPGGLPIPRQLGLFPGNPVSIERHGLASYDRYKVRTSIVRFDDGLACMRFDVGGIMEDGEVELCSRAYVDLVDGRFEIVQHYPGRLRALGLPARLIYRVLGARPPARQHRTELAPTKRQPLRSAAMAEGRVVGAIVSTGDPRAEVAHNPTPRAPDIEQGEFDTLDDGTAIERFPAAPKAPETGT
jgi:hypothetical protein